MVLKAFEIGIFFKPEKLKQSDYSNQSSDSDISLFTPKKEQDWKYWLLKTASKITNDSCTSKSR